MDGLNFLYGTFPGRVLLKLLVNRKVSELSGVLLDSPVSKRLIEPFIKHYRIDMTEYPETEYASFNDFFCRKIKPECRTIDMTKTNLIAPCDGLLSGYRITDNLVIPVKQSMFSISRLLRNRKLAEKYNGGICLVYRLCVNHYHRYVYVDSGKKTKNFVLPGVLHTVRPTALEATPVFTENCREYTVIRSEVFGPLVQMEVGAMLVGRIRNHEESALVQRGKEKGMFQYGGSTIIVLIPPQNMTILEPYEEMMKSGREVPVKMGQIIIEKSR